MSPGNQSNYFVHTLLRARDWQHRPQFDQVVEWWKSGGRGVCALIGIGGAGKSAIAERFLNELLEGKSKQIPPRSVFVYSFYDDDKPENFFRHLQIWLEGSPNLESVLSVGQIMFLVQQHQGLIILDGLEKLQESGARGGFGRLTSPSLRDLLNHIANGSARDLSVLATSRFPLPDLRDSQPRYFHTIAVEEIDLAAGVALLRDRGVRGTDVQLGPIVEHCGRHALTVDLAGHYIKEYGNGDPATPLNLGTAKELQAEAEQELDDDKRAVLIQSRRFSRIAQRYREAMLSSDAAALALLERICLFRLGVDRETLAAIFTGPTAEKISGKSLANLDADQLQKKLAWLVRSGIVEQSKSLSLTTENRRLKALYTIHPAVRESFLSALGTKATRLGHDAAAQILQARLSEQDGHDLSPSESALDLFEEIIYHTVEAGFLQRAIDIYWGRIGGYRNLIWNHGAYERGDRICRALNDGCPPEVIEFAKVLSPEKHALLVLEWGMYLDALGQLRRAVACYTHCARVWMDVDDRRSAGMTHEYLTKVFLRSGSLSKALPACDTAVTFAKQAHDEKRLVRALAFRGHGHAILGNVAAALRDFEDALEASGDLLYGQAGVYQSFLLARLGRIKSAIALLEANQRLVVQNWGSRNHHIPGYNLLRADLALRERDLNETAKRLDVVEEWALPRNAVDLLCCVNLTRSMAYIQQFEDGNVSELSSVRTSVESGLRLARDCGFSIYHIDLLLERARLHLLRGDAGAALEDVELALDTGIPANDETGQPELLAAKHEECGYAWAIPVGLQLRAEALLLRAAQTLQQDSYVPAKISDLLAEVAQLIDEAKQHLREALDRWHDLRDPEPTEDNNFKLDGKEYNYRAAETYKVLVQVEGGILTRYPLEAGANNEQAMFGDNPLIDPSQQTAPERGGSDFPNHSLNEQKRRVDAVAPSTARLSETLDLLVQVRLPGSPPLSISDWPLRHIPSQLDSDSKEATLFFPLDVATGRVGTARLLVCVVAPNFSTNGQSEKILLVPPDTHSALASFLLTPQKTGECRINVEVFDLSRTHLGNIFLTTSIQQTVSSNAANASSLELKVKINQMSFDTFLSHNSKDKPNVKQLGEALKKRRLTVWLDEWELRPGLSWQDALEDIIANCKSAAVCVGENGIGPWEDPEMKALLRRFVDEKKTGNIVPIIPVLLPGAPDNIKLPLFLAEFTWVDLRDGFKTEGLDRLQWGITGVKPNPS